MRPLHGRLLTRSRIRWSTSLPPPSPHPPPNPLVVEKLAQALAGGEPTIEAIVARASRTFGREFRWFTPLALRYRARFSPADRKAQPRQREVVAFLWADWRTQRALRYQAERLRVAEMVAETPSMVPVAAARAWPVPALTTVEGLAEWLRLSPSELAWFSDAKGLERVAGQAEALRHYRYRLVRKQSGGLRLVEAPKQRLKTMQRQVLDEILAAVPFHAAAHGFAAGRSIRGFAEPHTNQAVVLRLDLSDFFPSITGARVRTIFRTMGYPEHVADLLGGLCVNRAPSGMLSRLLRALGQAEVSEAHALKLLYGKSHLPQGAPTSPAIANLCFYRTDARLTGLARAAGAQYTRYADDLAFSGGGRFRRGIDGFAAAVAAICEEGGFRLNPHKTRVMSQGGRQHLAGLVVNERVNLSRHEFDRLKATLTNCMRRGPTGENREHRPDFRAHLAGRVSFFESIHAAHGAKLRAMLDQIDWGRE